MKTISLYQPYATLVVLGLKQFETRSWDTKVRGPLAIHATANFPAWAKKECQQEPFKSALAEHGYDINNLPRGAIVGTVELVSTQSSGAWLLNERYNTERKNDNEFHFGDYSPGRFAWELRKPVRFDKPIPAKGSQGFWNCVAAELQKTG